MPNKPLDTLVRDPELRSFNRAEQREIFRRLDPDFGALRETEQDEVLNHLLGTPSTALSQELEKSAGPQVKPGPPAAPAAPTLLPVQVHTRPYSDQPVMPGVTRGQVMERIAAEERGEVEPYLQGGKIPAERRLQSILSRVPGVNPEFAQGPTLGAAMDQPLVKVPAPLRKVLSTMVIAGTPLTYAPPKARAFIEGAQEGALGVLEGFTSPKNLSIMGGALTVVGGAAAIARVLPAAYVKTITAVKALPGLVSTYFTYDMFKSAVQAYPELATAVKEGNWEMAGRRMAELLASGAMGTIAGAHAGKTFYGAAKGMKAAPAAEPPPLPKQAAPAPPGIIEEFVARSRERRRQGTPQAVAERTVLGELERRYQGPTAEAALNLLRARVGGQTPEVTPLSPALQEPPPPPPRPYGAPYQGGGRYEPSVEAPPPEPSTPVGTGARSYERSGYQPPVPPPPLPPLEMDAFMTDLWKGLAEGLTEGEAFQVALERRRQAMTRPAEPPPEPPPLGQEVIEYPWGKIPEPLPQPLPEAPVETARPALPVRPPAPEAEPMPPPRPEAPRVPSVPVEGPKKKAVPPAAALAATPPIAKAAEPITPDLQPLQVGRQSRAKTPNYAVDTQFEVYEEGALRTSHDTQRRPLEDYPQELQQRQRERLSSDQQIRAIETRLDPEQLADNVLGQFGSPIIGPDRAVESGNGRVLALRRLYERSDPKAAAYKDWWVKHAEEYSLDPGIIASMERPIVVRRRLTELPPDRRVDWTRELNERATADLSPMEQALTDAGRVNDALLGSLRSGDLQAAANRGFLTQFMARVIPVAERGKLRDKQGNLTLDGLLRIQRALLAKAYGDTPHGMDALERMSESTDHNIKNVTGSMMQQAPRLTRLRRAMDAGELHADLDLRNDLAVAAIKLAQLKKTGWTVEDYINQDPLFGRRELTPVQERLLEVMGENARSANRLNKVFGRYLDLVESAGRPRPRALIDRGTPAEDRRLRMLDRAVEDVTREREGMLTESIPTTAYVGPTRLAPGPPTQPSLPISAATQPRVGPMNMPELVRLLEDLQTGQYPKIVERVLGNDLIQGLFQPSKGRITLRADLFKDPRAAMEVLSHEFGHFLDWIPEGTLARGNILGRLASMIRFMRGKILGPRGNPVLRKDVMAELGRLTQLWRPLDEALDPKYTKYRHGARELYADAVSVLFNQPDLLRREAPVFYDTFFDYLNRKPEFQKVYNEAQQRMTGGTSMSEIIDRMLDNSRKHEEKVIAQGDPYETPFRKAVGLDLVDKYDATLQPAHDLLGPVIKKGGRPPSEVTTDPRFAINLLEHVGSLMKAYAQDISKKVHPILIQARIPLEEFGVYRRLRDTLSEHARGQGKAAPGGIHGDSTVPGNALEGIAELARRLGPGSEAAMWEAHKAYFPVRKENVIDRLREAEMLDNRLQKFIETNEDYSRREVTEYLDQQHGAGAGQALIGRRIGTVAPEGNSFVNTVVNDQHLIWAAVRQSALVKTVELFKRTGEWQKAPTRTVSIGPSRFAQQPLEPPPGSKWELVSYLHKGKWEGHWIPREAADGFNRNPLDVGIIAEINHALLGPLKQWFTKYSVTFNLRNPFKDVRTAVRNLPGLTYPQFLPYVRQARRIIWKDVYGGGHPLVEQMRKEGMLITESERLGLEPGTKQFEREMRKWGLNPGPDGLPSRWEKTLLDRIGRVSQLSDGITKVASYKWLLEQHPEYSVSERSYMVNKLGGSPDFARHGRAAPVMNLFQLFYNPFKEGWRSFLEAREASPGEFGWKLTKYYILPKVFSLSVKYGIPGLILGPLGYQKAKEYFDEIAQLMQRMPQYDELNFNTVPLGWAGNRGKVAYFMAPLDAEGRAINAFTHLLFDGALAKVTGTPTDKVWLPRLAGAKSLLDVTAEGMPSINTLFQIGQDVYDYSMDKPVYDSFRGREAISKEMQEAARSEWGGSEARWRARKTFVKYLLGQMGAGSVYRFKGDTPELVQKEWLETLLDIPVAGRIPGAFFRVSDAGMREGLQEAMGAVSANETAINLAFQDALRKSLTEQALLAKEQQALALKLGTRNPTLKWRAFTLYARAYGMTALGALLQARTKAQKIAVLDRMVSRYGSALPSAETNALTEEERTQ